MLDYISAIYHGDPIRTPAPNPLDNRGAALCGHLERVRREMGAAFAGELERTLRVELNGGREWAFQRGFQLGGQLMLAFLDDEED